MKEIVFFGLLIFARSALLFFLVVGWWKLGYGNGTDLRARPRASYFAAMGLAFILILLGSRIVGAYVEDLKIRDEQKNNPMLMRVYTTDNIADFKLIVLLGFPWIYLAIRELSRAFLAKNGYRKMPSQPEKGAK